MRCPQWRAGPTGLFELATLKAECADFLRCRITKLTVLNRPTFGANCRGHVMQPTDLGATALPLDFHHCSDFGAMNTMNPHFGQLAKTNSPWPSQQAHLSSTSPQLGGLKFMTALRVERDADAQGVPTTLTP